MDKKIEDYLHLYLGCCYRLTPNKYTPGYKSSRTTKVRYTNFYPLMDKIKNPIYYDFKLILRPLSDMTEEEFNYSYKKGWTNHSESQSAYTATVGVMEPEEFLYLLFKHFDLFGLIEAGLAIDKTTLK